MRIVSTPRLISLFGGRPVFWRLLALARRIRFRLSTAGFRGLHYRSAAADGTAASWRVARGAASAALAAVVVLAAIWSVHRWRFDLLTTAHLNHGWFAQQAHRGVSTSSYDTMLQTLAGVGGVFLALYFTAISAVAATVYASVPHNVRNLLLRDRESGVYVWIVALLTSLSSLLLLARSANATVWLPAIPVLAVLSLLAVYAFIRVSRRTFYFFDPTMLASPLEKGFRAWAQRAAHGQYRADDPSFQDHYRRQATAMIDSLEALGRMAASGNAIDVAPLAQVARSTGRILRWYTIAKSAIPSDSKWFGARLQHKQWYLASAIEVNLASATNTSLQPEVVPDRDWVERHLTAVVTDVVDLHLERRRFQDAAEAVAIAAECVESLAQAGQMSLAVEWAEELLRGAVSAALSDSPNEREQREIVALLDTAMMLLGSIAIGVLRQERQFNVEELRRNLRNAKTIRETALRQPLHPSVKEHLETVAAKLELEDLADAPVKTASWFVAETTLNVLALALEKDIRDYFSWAVNLSRTVVDEARTAARPVEAAAMSSRGVELAWRLANVGEETEQLASAIDAAALLGDDLQRPRWEWDRQRRRIAAFQVVMAERLAEQIPHLAALEPRQDIPDYFGEAVHRAGEACFDALVSNNAVLFGRLFAHYLFGARAVAERIRSQLQRQHPVAALPWLNEPILDLLSLSGHALIYAELNDEPALWHAARDQWDALVASGGRQMLELLAAIVAYRQGQLGLGPRDLVRTWDDRTGSVLRQLPATTASSGFLGASTSRTVHHASPLIRELGGEHLGFIDEPSGLDVFVARYLMNHSLSHGLDFGIPVHRTDDIRSLPTLRSEQ